MELSVKAPGGGSQTIQVSPSTFGRDYNESLVHQVVTAHLAGSRQGTKAQKTRSEVSGSTAKPWRQKGTGRARAGTIRSPVWVGGGRAFAARPRNFDQKVNRKMYQGAMRSILSELVRQERLMVVEELKVDQPKTKELISKLKELGLNDVLIIVDQPDDNLYLAARNVPKVQVKLSNEVDPIKLLKYENVLVTVGAIRKLEEAFK